MSMFCPVVSLCEVSTSIPCDSSCCPAFDSDRSQAVVLCGLHVHRRPLDALAVVEGVGELRAQEVSKQGLILNHKATAAVSCVRSCRNRKIFGGVNLMEEDLLTK